jgi:hypothetical protein
MFWALTCRPVGMIACIVHVDRGVVRVPRPRFYLKPFELIPYFTRSFDNNDGRLLRSLHLSHIHV